MPSTTRNLSLSKSAIATQQASLVDPIIPEVLQDRNAWQALEAAATPSRFSEGLVGSAQRCDSCVRLSKRAVVHDLACNERSKGFQSRSVVRSRPRNWQQNVSPSPLSAQTGFAKTASGRLVPQWTVIWSYENTRIRQSLFSYQPQGFQSPAVFVRFEINNAPVGSRLAVGTGRRLNANYWDDKSLERTPVPFFTLEPGCRQVSGRLLDQDGRVLFVSNNPITLDHLGQFEDLLLLAPDTHGIVELCTPQGGT